MGSRLVPFGLAPNLSSSIVANGCVCAHTHTYITHWLYIKNKNHAQQENPILRVEKTMNQS